MELRMKLTRKRVALAVVAVALAATGSVGWAAIGEGGTVQGCVAGNGTIDAIDPVTQACRDRQTPVEWYTKAGADAAFVNADEGAKVRGWEWVSAYGYVPGNSSAWVTAQCPPGKVVVGGGFFIQGGEGLTVDTSAPAHVMPADRYEWQVNARNTTAASRLIHTIASCVSG